MQRVLSVGGEPEFRFPNNCYTRLDAQFNIFNFKVEKGGLNGRCQYDMECVGFIFLAIGPWDVGGSSNPRPFFNDTTSEETNHVVEFALQNPN